MFKFSMPTFILLTCILVAQGALAQAPTSAPANEDGYEMWLRYHQVSDAKMLKAYRTQLGRLVIEGSSPTLTAAQAELQRGLGGLRQ